MQHAGVRSLGLVVGAVWGLLGAGMVQARPVTISGLQSADGSVNFTVNDDAPQDMCVGGLCFGDFTVNYNPALLAFRTAVLGLDLPADASPDAPGFLLEAGDVAGGPQGAQVFLSLIGADPSFVFTTPTLFSLSFTALMTGVASVDIQPRDFGTGEPPSYAFEAGSTRLLVTAVPGQVPEPASYALVALALAGSWVARRRAMQRAGGA